MSALAPDVRRAVYALFGVAVVSVGLALVYANHYLFRGELGQTVPDISPSSGELVLAFQVTAVLSVVWATSLGWLGTPGGARRLTEAVERWVEREAASGRAVWVAAGLAVAYAALRFGANVETVHAPLDALTAGDAVLPFQYRALVPWLVRAAVEGAPAASALDPRVLYGVVEWASAFGVYAGCVYLVGPFVRAPATARVAALGVFVPLAFNLGGPWRYNAIYFPYDTPSVAFFALGLGLLLRRRYWAYYVLFAVATLNRETTCFLTLAHIALLFGKERPWRVALHGAAQVGVWVGIKVGLGALYASNPPLDPIAGGLFATMIDRSVRIVVSVPGLVYISGVTMGGLGAVLLLLHRRVRDSRIRRLLWVGVPFFAGMFVVGELMEVRIYSELIPIVGLGLLASLGSVVTEAAGRGVSAEERHAESGLPAPAVA